MHLTPATPADYPAIVSLANLAYRPTVSIPANHPNAWTNEANILAGLRITELLLSEDLAQHPEDHLLLYRDEATQELLGTVRLSPHPSQTWHLSLLAIHPAHQARQLGRALLTAAEAFARTHGAQRMHITVLNVRTTLLAWYHRRGYHPTGQIEPFPYNDARFGQPLQPNLHFIALEKPL